MLLDEDGPRVLGGPEPIVVVGEAEKPPGTWAGRRILSVRGRQAFELGFWCGTCPFLFERSEGSTETLSIDQLQEQLNTGLTNISPEVVGPFAALLERGEYLVLLLEIEPTLV